MADTSRPPLDVLQRAVEDGLYRQTDDELLRVTNRAAWEAFQHGGATGLRERIELAVVAVIQALRDADAQVKP